MTELNTKTNCCSTPNINKSDIRINIDSSKCTGCGLCEEICPMGLPKKNKLGKYNIIDPKSCTECSACQRNCPAQAINMNEQVGCGCLWDARKRINNKEQSLNCC